LTQLTATPTEIRAGDSLDWLIANSDYPATSSWTMTYKMVNAASAVSMSSSASGADHLFDIAPATTAAYTSGDYEYQAYVDDGTDRHTVETGFITILPALSVAADLRSHVKITLDAIQATIQGTATKDQASYSIASRSLSRRTISELLELEDVYLRRWKAEQDAENRKNGRVVGGRVLVKMNA